MLLWILAVVSLLFLATGLYAWWCAIDAKNSGEHSGEHSVEDDPIVLDNQWPLRVIFFGHTSCVFCTQFGPTFQALEQRNPGIAFEKVECSEVVCPSSIRRFPTIVFVNGPQSHVYRGSRDIGALQQLLDTYEAVSGDSSESADSLELTDDSLERKEAE